MEYIIQDTTMTAIGDAIREKTGRSGVLTPAQMVTEIESISGGLDLTKCSRVDFQQKNDFDTVVIEGESVRAMYVSLEVYGITSANQIKLVEISEIGPVSSTSQAIYAAQDIITLNPPYRLTRRENIKVTELTTPPTFTTGKSSTIVSTTKSGCLFNESSKIFYSKTLNDLISKCNITIYYEEA